MIHRNLLLPFLFGIYLFASCSQETAIPVNADFSIEVENDDYSVPVRLLIKNKSEEADSYVWTFEGGNPPSSTDKNPGTIQFEEAGFYGIELTASNRDGSTDTKVLEVLLEPKMEVGFEPIVVKDNFSPMTVNFVNTSKGADSYVWTFEEGMPHSSRVFEPQGIVFEQPGEHSIFLEVGNGRESQTLEKKVTVASHLIADFDFVPAFEDDDFQAPVTLTLNNLSVSATSFDWNFQWAQPTTSTNENPEIVFPNPGNYLLELTASNGKQTQTISKNVTINPNTNLRVFEDIELGINTAHSSNTKGAFFSTKTRKSYNASEVSSVDGNLIDMVFYGLDENFTFNKFVSPDDSQNFTFIAIPEATKTKFINLQEDCGCEASLTVAEFDAMQDDSQLDALVIEETIGGIQDFDDSVVPRIVLFETDDGRKGAIKIKEFVANGSDSYVVVDIKVQKE